jgi:hypothetical protein
VMMATFPSKRDIEIPFKLIQASFR